MATDRRLLPPDERERASAIAELSSSLAEPASTRLLEEHVVQRVWELVGDVAALWRRATRATSSCGRRPTATPSGGRTSCTGPPAPRTATPAVIAVALDDDRLLRQARASLSEQNRAPLAAHRAALSDALTGLPNRRLLLERLHALVARDGQQLALLIIDLDDFKHLNDAHGHSAGDAALVEVADRLRALVRDPGLGGRTTLARLGGDEFAVLLSLGDQPDVPLRLAEAISAGLSEPLTSIDGVVRTGASIGVARASGGAASTLMRHADIAMYRAKRTRTGWAEYDPGRDGAAEVHLRELNELDQALTDGGLHLVYQPVVARRRAVPPGPLQVEALVRWDHPHHGPLAPADFLPLAQRSGRMGALSDAVLRIALAYLTRWRAEGRDVLAPVNVGAEVLAAGAFLPTLQRWLDEHVLPPHLLCLQLIESEALCPEGRMLLEQVRATGMTVALDDLGTGYSSLSSLADCPSTGSSSTGPSSAACRRTPA